MPLVLFHAARVNVDLFKDLLAEDDSDSTVSVVREDLLKRVLEAGEMTDLLRAQARNAMRAALHEAGQDARLLCTCTTIGAAADDLKASGLAAFRTDRALAREALSRGPKVAVVISVRSAEAPVRALFAEVSAELGVEPEFEVIIAEDAWPLMEAGDVAGYHRAIARTVDGLEGGYDVIALAQASMHGAAELTERPVLTSPQVGLDSIAA